MAESHAKHLARTVARAFYDDDVVVVMDALCRERYLIDHEQAGRGPLEDKFGLQAKQVRQILQALYDDRLIDKFVRTYVDVNAPKGTRKKKRTFWFINYLHLVKLVRLRVHKMINAINRKEEEDVTTQAQYECKECQSDFDVMTAMQFQDEYDGRFYCGNCYKDMEEKIYLEEINDHKQGTQKPKRLKEKREEQLVEARGLRDGIMEILDNIDKQPLAPPTNHPNEHINNDMHNKIVEIQRAQAEAQGLIRPQVNTKNQTSFVDSTGQNVQVRILGLDEEDTSAIANKATKTNPQETDYSQGELPAWMTHDVKGDITTTAIQDAKERAAKRQKTTSSLSANNIAMSRGGAAALLQAKEAKQAGLMPNEDKGPALEKSESQVKADSERYEYECNTIVKVDGEEKRLIDVTEDDANRMTEEEYEAYVAAKRGDETQDSMEQDEEEDFF